MKTTLLLKRPLTGVALAFVIAVGAAAYAADSDSTKTPRLADGHPDLNGIWDNGGGVAFLHPQDLGNGSICLIGCAPPPGAKPTKRPPRAAFKPDFPSYKPEFAAKVKDLSDRQVKEDPVIHCLPPGVPRIGPPDKIVQTSTEAIFLYEDVSGSFFRIVPTDGRGHRDDVEPTYLGDAVGKWDGDTLVVETVNFTPDTWLTDNGAFHTDNVKVVERIHRMGDKLEWDATVYDPEVLTEPWHLKPRMAALSDSEIVESPPCIEQDLDHVVDGTHHDNPR
jgi:hypothetical protein